MDLVAYFAKEWNVIWDAPATFIIGALLLLGAAYTAASWRFGGIIESQRAQIELLDRKLSAHPGGVDFEKRKVIVDALGGFLARGTALMVAAKEYEQPAPLGLANAWLKELCDYLEAELGAAYVARVNDGGSAPVGYSGGPAEHNNVYNVVRVRVFHLQEFLKEMARA